jgi:hypothetical protein
MKNKRDKRRELKEYSAEETFHRREWIVQRVGWVALAALLVAACAGLLGNGPLAHRTLATQHGVFKFDRFTHRNGPTQWVVEAESDSATRLGTTLEVSASLLRRIKIDAITPAPRVQVAMADGVLFKFDAARPQVQIVFHIQPQYVGWMEGEIQLNDSPPATIKQFVYP